MADVSKEKAESSGLQEGLKMLRRCPLCKQDFGEEAVRIVEQREATHLVHITCPHCQNAVLAVILVSALGMSSVGVLTDLGAAEVSQMRRKSPINEDDLLGFFKFLESGRAGEQVRLGVHIDKINLK